MRKGVTFAVVVVGLLYLWSVYDKTPAGLLMRVPGQFYSRAFMIVLTTGVVASGVWLAWPWAERVTSRLRQNGVRSGDYVTGFVTFIIFNVAMGLVLDFALEMAWRTATTWAVGISSLVLGPAYIWWRYSRQGYKRAAVYFGYAGGLAALLTFLLLTTPGTK